MKRIYKFGLRFVCTSLVLASCSVALGKGRLHKLWDFQVSGIINSDFKASSKEIAVFGIEFSPDGKEIVVVIGPSIKKQIVLIVSAEDPKKNIKRLNTQPDLYDVERSRMPKEITWLVPGNRIAIGHALYDIASQNSCVLPNDSNYVFSVVGPNRIVGSSFHFFDWNCQNTGEIKPSILDAGWELLDTSADRGLICVHQEIVYKLSLIGSEVQIIDAENEKTLMRIPSIEYAQFAENGKVLCGLNGKDWHIKVRCWEVDTGKKISTSKEFRYCVLRTARYAQRMVISDYGRTLDYVSWFWAVGTKPKRTIWDYRTNKEIVSWKSKMQKYIDDRYNEPFRPRRPYSFALSPDGNYLIEGGEGMLTMYKIVP